MTTSLVDKVALVTGSGRGIGRAVAIALAQEHCRVVITARNPQDVADALAEARAAGAEAIGLPLDLTIDDDLARLVDETTTRLGPIDFLVNNAAVLLPVALLATTAEQWDQTMQLNLRSVFLLSQKVLQQMVGRRSGYIINIASAVAHGAKQEVAAYSASKFGLVGLSQALYGAGKPYGVRVSTIYPGTTDTPMIRDLAGENRVGDPADWMQPEDIAYCVLFLLKQSPRMVVKELTPWAVGYDRI